MPTLSKSMSLEDANKNEVSIEKLLTSIFVFHECGEHLGHPYIELHSDGSGRVVESRTGEQILQFRSLKELVNHADNLIKKYNIKWAD